MKFHLNRPYPCTSHDRVLVFSPDSGTWQEGTASTRAVYGASAAWLDDRIYLAGGRTAPGGMFDVGNVLYHGQSMQILAKGAWWTGLYPRLPASGMAGRHLVPGRGRYCVVCAGLPRHCAVICGGARLGGE